MSGTTALLVSKDKEATARPEFEVLLLVSELAHTAYIFRRAFLSAGGDSKLDASLLTLGITLLCLVCDKRKRVQPNLLHSEAPGCYSRLALRVNEIIQRSLAATRGAVDGPVSTGAYSAGSQPCVECSDGERDEVLTRPLLLLQHFMQCARLCFAIECAALSPGSVVYITPLYVLI